MGYFKSARLPISGRFEQANCRSLDLPLNQPLFLREGVFEGDFAKGVALDKSAGV